MTDEPPQKPPDMLKWLSKISSVAADYATLVKTLTTPSLSAMFGEHVLIHLVPSPAVSKYDKILTADDIRSEFYSLKLTKQTFIENEPEAFEDLVCSAEVAAKKRMPVVHILT